MTYLMFHKSLQAVILCDIFPRIFLLLKETFITKGVKCGGVSHLLSILNAREFRRRKITVDRVSVFWFFSGWFSRVTPSNKGHVNFSVRLFQLSLGSCQVSSSLESRLWKKTTDGMEVAALSPVPFHFPLTGLYLSKSLVEIVALTLD